MKELSIEQKARRYDEAIDMINKCATDKYGCLLGVKPTDIFHELSESEDERIRKALIRLHKSTIDVDGIKGEDIIAWLEKQGEQKLAKKTTWYDNMDDLIADAMIDDIKNADMPEHCKHNRLTWINKHRSKRGWQLFREGYKIDEEDLTEREREWLESWVFAAYNNGLFQKMKEK